MQSNNPYFDFLGVGVKQESMDSVKKRVKINMTKT